MAVFDELKEMVVDQLGINPDDFTEDKDIIKDLGCDSLDIVDMLMAIEDKYGFEVDDSEVASLKTIGDVVSYIESKIA
ncbi:MAG: acyl carrier protein [Clostridia bacterium]|nr:acyl carrier protein [Clostridia bacterium]